MTFCGAIQRLPVVVTVEIILLKKQVTLDANALEERECACFRRIANEGENDTTLSEGHAGRVTRQI